MSVFDKCKEWNIANVELSGQLRFFFNVDLADFDFALTLCRDFFKCRRQCDARAAPVCPKVDENWYVAF